MHDHSLKKKKKKEKKEKHFILKFVAFEIVA